MCSYVCQHYLALAVGLATIVLQTISYCTVLYCIVLQFQEKENNWDFRCCAVGYNDFHNLVMQTL
jgi:hypothetical protein